MNQLDQKNIGVLNKNERNTERPMERRNQNQMQRDDGVCKGTFVGKVKHIRIEGGRFAYGFITVPDATVDDIFVHYRDIEPWRDGFKELKEGDIVKFDMHETKRGLQARNVEIKREPIPAKITDFKTVPDNIGNQGKN